LYLSEYGDTSAWGTSIDKLVDFLIGTVLKDKTYADMFDKDTADKLDSANVIIDAVISEKKYSAKEASKMLKKLTDELDSNTVELLYLYYGSQKNSDKDWTMSIETLFYHLADNVVNDKKFDSFIDKDMKKEIKDLKVTLKDGIDQLVGENYSIMMINTTYPDESTQTHHFIDTVNNTLSDNVAKDYYMIGNSVMNYEMQNTFHKEVLLMTILTALSIFVIVALTFRSISIPAILVLIVQCSVYITVAYSGLTQGPMQYIAYLLVQCILMGATIDYAILFTNYYKRYRKQEIGIKEALQKAYQGSIHTIFTSGAVLLTVTGIIGGFAEGVTGDACKQVAIGTFVAILMILFVLPGTIAVFDKMLLRRERKRQLKSMRKATT
jgi:predicted RND superfamily exporter protein